VKQNINLKQIEILNYNDQKLLVKEIGIYDWWKKQEHLLDIRMTEYMLNYMCKNATIGKLIEFIKKYYQMDIYTVGNSWHIQLFELEVDANDQEPCIYEDGYGENELVDVLFTCAVWVILQIRDNN